MKTQTLIRISEMILLSVAVSLVMLAMVYVVQGHTLTPVLTIVR